ncbi:MAG: response regulator [Pseudomonadota bacterium]
MTSSKDRTILIVEDNEMNMKLARDVLEVNGYQIVAATSGEQGLKLAPQTNPNAVLLDIQLPDLDGVEVFQRLREDPQTAQIPVIAFTASVTAVDKSRVKDAGFDGFVSKPIDLKSFVATVDQVVMGGSK